MIYHDRQYLNPPSIWNSNDLKTLHHRLIAYQGQDRFDHPYQVSHSHTHEIEACVLVLITNEICPRLLLTKRSHRLASHKGEIAFVGGHRDKTDVSTAHTALREAFEEVGLVSEQVCIIGYLPIQTAKSGKAVRPVVGVIDKDTVCALIGAECEIERIFWVDLDYFVKTLPHEICLNYNHRNFYTLTWYCDGEMVWGLTGRIIANLIEIGYCREIEWYYKLIS